MALSSDTHGDIARPSAVPKKRKWLLRVLAVLSVLLAVLVLLAWVSRDKIARDLIGDQLAQVHLSATYDIENISAGRQVLANIIIGDPAKPDLTIERVEAEIVYRFGFPELGRITVVKPRLFGRYQDGKLSFGALDSVVFADTGAPSGLPDIDLVVSDARGLLVTEYGLIGWKAEGAGALADGFAGFIAATAPDIRVAHCTLEHPSMYGKISTKTGQIRLDGPLRLPALGCDNPRIELAGAAMALGLTVDESFSKIDIDASVSAEKFSFSEVAGSAMNGPVRLSADADGVRASFGMSGAGFGFQEGRAAKVTLEGSLRVQNAYQTAEIQADISADDIISGPAVSRNLQALAASAKGTLLNPLIAEFDAAQQAQLQNARFAASITARMYEGGMSIAVPQATLRNRNDETILSLSRLHYRQLKAAQPKLTGDFRMGGGRLPVVAGRMEQSGSAGAVFRLKMPRYAKGNNWLEIPELIAVQGRGGVQFNGSIIASGVLPGGAVRNLALPVQGGWAKGHGLSMWNACTAVRFDSLSFANLDLASRKLTVCPPPDRAIVEQNGRGLTITAGISALDLRGSLAGTDLVISSGPLGLAYPGADAGAVTAREVEVALGPAGQANRFALADITAQFGDRIGGRFSGAEVGLFTVPLDVSDASGEWAYRDGDISISAGLFTLSDRNDRSRFEPLVARQATFELTGEVLTANALLRNPDSDRVISAVDMRHDLGTATGFADLTVANLLFDDSLQPDQLTYLADGVVALVEGVVTGSGRIEWSGDTLSSSGVFSSEALNFAAVFGPVKGARGSVEFTDLLSLTTAPDQEIYVASVNPGIEVFDGVLGFSLRAGQYLGVTGGTWPFMGGRLTLRPVSLNLSASEERRYVLEVDSLDAALFVENMDIGNLAATGLFDGQLPIVFDRNGFGKIIGGSLVSRAPGGSVSYVGELSYRDLSPMANYAFTTLRSLNYDTMQIDMNGLLTGDILTQVRFDGVKQGEGTKKNFITRQIANLPIRLNVNIRASFYELFTNLRSAYDPSALRDPRTVGLMRDNGTRFLPANNSSLPAEEEPLSDETLSQPEAIRPAEPSIQTPDRQEMP